MLPAAGRRDRLRGRVARRRLHDHDLPAVGDVDDPAVLAPVGIDVLAAAGRETPLLLRRDVDHPDLLRLVAAHERDLLAVRTPGRLALDLVLRRRQADVAVPLEDIELGIALERQDRRDLRAVRRERGLAGHGVEQDRFNAGGGDERKTRGMVVVRMVACDGRDKGLAVRRVCVGARRIRVDRHAAEAAVFQIEFEQVFEIQPVGEKRHALAVRRKHRPAVARVVAGGEHARRAARGGGDPDAIVPFENELLAVRRNRGTRTDVDARPVLGRPGDINCGGGRI